ncbi:hypothetical protein VE03_10546 [Pseudogymnoascus sp. 23342-1-I1]|nr:hypothetical protein VE03_10546 [Pseudogymnoascus sp. 23342-1-I1]
MSKPYSDTFDSVQSPLASRAAAASAPVSYQANVNRQKTKKWVDAKPVSYGGDDWGDDYDDGYDDTPPPPPVPKVTGFRQPGQGVRNDVGIKKTYGELPHLPKDVPDRSSTNPPLLRQSSFSRDDERRAFSSGPSQQDVLASNTAPTATPSPPLRLASQRKQLPPPGTESSARSSYAESNKSSAHTASDARSASGDAHNNYPAHDVTSPLRSAALAPQARAASPLSRSDSPPANVASPPAQFSPRNTTLSQATVPDLSAATPAAPAPAPVPVTKALPFIRPADIYKRLEEERQRKASGDSSMDSVADTNPDTQSSPGLPSQTTAEPVVAVPVAQAPAEPVTYNRGGYDTYEEDVPDYGREAETYQEEVPDYGHRQAPMLESVQERRSEYGFDDMAAKSPEAAQKLQQEVQKQEISVQQYQAQAQEPSNIQQQTHALAKAQEAQPEATGDADGNRRYSMSPKLPDLHRMSGFGFDMWSQSAPDGNVANSPVAERQLPNSVEQPLQRQESQGFTSVVHQAFDRTDSIPETPTSQDASNVRRHDSDSTGTTGISPIMSRVSSGANPDSRGRTQEPRDNLTPAIAEEKEPDSRRVSGIVHEADEPSQTPFHLGHRRDLSAPSNGNSPARSPKLETADLAQSAEVEGVAEETRPILPTAVSRLSRPDLPGAWNSYNTTADQSEPAETEISQTEAVSNDPAPVELSQSLETTAPLQPPVDQDRSTPASSAAPSPPLKDDVVLPPLTTRNPEDDAAPKDYSETQNPLVKLPTLSTNASPTDDETDRLRKEIVRSLSPRDSVSNAAQDWVPPPNASSRQSTLGLPSPGAPRDSMYLPSEYDNYWAETEEDAQAQSQSQEQTAPVSDAAASSHLASTGLHKVEESEDIPTIAPLSPKRASVLLAEPIQPVLERKFSWEALPEQVAIEAPDSQSPPAIVTQPIVAERAEEQGALSGATVTRSGSASPAPLSLRSARASTAGIQPEGHKDSVGSEGVVTEAVAAAAVVAPAVSTIRPVTADSEDAAPAYSKAISIEGIEAVSPMSTKVEPVRSQSQQINSMLDIGASQTPPPQDGPAQSFTPVQSNDVSRPQIPVDPTKPKPFKEIMSLSSPQQRINGYNESRQQFANMDSGLANWMHATSAQPHLQNPLASSDPRASAPSSQRPKSGNILAPQPQPYYQQYLNASTPTASPPPAARYSGGTPTTGSQGFGSTSSKTTQQVQAKSKELLHTAGIFGGRASKAGKGLLAKGKSRFKGSGDKDTTTTTAKATSPTTGPPTIDTNKPTKPSRRASWAFSLSSSPSTARPSTFSGAEHALFGLGSLARSSESSDSVQAAAAAAPAELGTENRGLLELNLPPTTMMDPRWAGVSETATAAEMDGSVSRTREESVAEAAAGGSDDIAPPMPIGKYQPSWDPFNATPIVEEEGFGWESPAKGSAVPVPAEGWRGVDEVVPETETETEMEGEGGNKEGEGEGWVMVEEERVRMIMGGGEKRPVHERGDSEVSALTVVGMASEEQAPMERLEEGSEVSVGEEAGERDVQDEAVIEQVDEPVDEHVVEPVAEPVAEPVFEPVAEPVAEPAVEPVAESVAEPITEPEVEPVVEPVIEPTAEPVAEPFIESVAEPVVEPVIERSAEPVVESVTEPVVEPVIEPANESIAEPVVDPIAKPVAEPVTEPVIEHIVEPVMEHVDEPVVEPTVEAVAEPVIEGAAEPVVEPVYEPVVEPGVESVLEPAAESTIEPTDEPAVEPVAEPVAEPAVEESILAEPFIASVVERAAEPAVASAIETTVEPAVESVAEPVAEEPVIAAVLPDIATNGHTPKQPDSEVPAPNAEVSPELTYISPVDAPIENNKRQAGLWSAGATVETPTSFAPETPSDLTPVADQPSHTAAFAALPPIRRSSTFDFNSVTGHAKALSTDGVEQDDLRSSGAVSPVSVAEPQETIPEEPPVAMDTPPLPEPRALDRGSDETVRKATQRYSFQGDSDEPEPEILNRPTTTIAPRNGDALQAAPIRRSISPGRPLVPPIITSRLTSEPLVGPGFVGQMLEAPGAPQFPPVQQQRQQEELSPVEQPQPQVQQQQQQQQQYVPVQQGQFSPVQQRKVVPVPQGQVVQGQQGQYPPVQQRQFAPPQGQQGQYPPVQQGQLHPRQQGQYPPQPGQYPPMQQGQFVPGQQGHLFVAPQGQRPPQQQMLGAPHGQLPPLQQRQVSQMPPHMLPQQQGLPRLPQERMPPVQQGQIPPAQQGPRSSMPPSAHQRRSSSDAQPRMRTASNSSQGVPMSAGGFLQQQHGPPGQQQRTSIEGMRNRPPSMSGVSQPPKIAPQYTENRQSVSRGSSGIPPSSSERYPELFQPQQTLLNEANRDVPPEYPSVERGHLARQQATEYEIPGVGPPVDDPRNGPVRHSRKPSMLKELGGRLSRGSSLERNLSALEDDGTREMRSQLDSRRDSVASSDDMSLDDLEKQPERRRSRIIQALTPTGRGPTPDIPPPSRESMVTHRPSQANLLGNTPVPGSPLAPPDKKRSFFGRSDTGGLEKKEDRPKMFSRQSTQLTLDSKLDKAGKEKKNRFSAISSMFTGKKGDAGGRGSSRHGSYVPSMLPGIMILVKNENERQILEQEGLVRKALPQVQEQPQPQPQQQVPVDPATLQRINTGEAPRQQVPSQGQNVPGRPVQQQMTPIAQQAPPPPHQQFQTIAPLSNRQDSSTTIGTIGDPLEKQLTQPTGVPQQQMAPPVGVQGQTRRTPPQMVPIAQPPQGRPSDNKAMPPPSFGSARISEEPIDLQQRNVGHAPHQQIQPIGTPGGRGTPPRMPNLQQQAPVASTTSRESTPRPTADADRRASVISGPDPEDRLRRRTTQPIETPPGQHLEDKSLILNRPVAAQPQGQVRASMIQQRVTPPTQPAYRPEDIHQLSVQQQPPPPIQRQQTFNTVPGQQHQGVYETPPTHYQQMYMNSQAQQQPTPDQHAQQAQQHYARQILAQQQHALQVQAQHQLMYGTPPIQHQQQMYTGSPMQQSGFQQPGFQQAPRVQSPAMSQQTASPPPTAQAAAPAPAKAKKGLFSSLLGGRRSSAMADKSSANQQAAPPQQTPPPQGYGIAPMGQQPLQQQQYYVTPPIPGAYALVRGEGTLAPTGYDPRGLNQPGPARLPPHMIEEYPGRPNAPPMNYASKWAAQDAAVQAALQAKKDEEWNTPPTVPFLSPEKTAARRLSSEDLLARSPARGQFGQQAPYQLRLPGDEEMRRERGRQAAEALRQAEDARIAAEAVMRAEAAGMVEPPREERTLVAPAPPPKSVSPASAESRVKSQAQSQSPSPMPKAADSGRANAGTPPVVAGPQKPLERSDTITSAVSKMSSSGRGSPAVGAPGAAAAAAAAATLGATVDASASGTAVAERRMSRIMPDHEEKIYDDSREGMIVVEDATVRRVNGMMIGGVLHEEEEEGPKVKMSATSFPGDEWRPWIEEGEGL